MTYNDDYENNNYHNDGMDRDHTQQSEGQDTEDSSLSAKSGPSESSRETVYVSNRPQKPQKKKSGAGAGFFGGFLGGIVSVGLVLLLLMTNVIPGITITEQGTTDGSNPSQTASSDKPNIVKTISDGSEVASGIDEASDAVVGVLNLQQQDIWSQSQEAGTGSGIIYKKEDGQAYVVTNEHVVSNAENVEVVLNDEKRIDAKVLGTDSLTDLAILEIDGEQIDTVAKIGSSSNLKVGETVLAIGNPLGMEFANSLTKGIISGLNRSVSVDTNGDRQPDWVSEVIQTDAAINPGNSGGALVNEKGEVIGINSMKIAKQTVEGMSFAIPIDTALPIMEQLETKGEVARPFIGISMVPINQVPAQYRGNVQLPEDVEGGVVIAQVQKGSPAEKADLKQFDVITKIGDNEVKNVVDLRTYLYRETTIGDTVKMEVYRNGKPKNVELTLDQRQE